MNLFFLVLAVLLLFQISLIYANLFYFAKDTEKILHFPLKPIEILLAKFGTLLGMLYITEAMIAVIPLILYGIFTHANLLIFVWEVIILIIFPIILEILIGILMFPIMKFNKWIKNKDKFQFIITLILIIGICFLEVRTFQIVFGMKNESQATEQVIHINEKVKQINQYFFMVQPTIKILTNSNNIYAIIGLLQLISYIVVSGTIFIQIGKLTYLKDIIRNMTDRTNKKRKKIQLEKVAKKRKKSFSYIIKEIKILIKEPIFFIQCIFPVMIILITAILLTVVLLPIFEKVLQDELIKDTLQNISFNMEIACDILIILQVLFSISNISLTAISREGKNAVLMKSIPITLYQQFVYKNMPQILLNVIICVVILGIVWYLIANLSILYLCMLFVIALLINVINSYLMLVVDLRRPNLNWDTQYSVVKKSDNKLFQYVFMIVNILFLMYLAKIFKNIHIGVALVGEMVIYTVLFVIMNRMIKKWQNKLFDKII